MVLEGRLSSWSALWERTSSVVQTLELSSGLFHGKVSRFVSAGSERVARAGDQVPSVKEVLADTRHEV